MNLLKVKVIKEYENNILWPIKKFQKFFMAHQFLAKIFNNPAKTLRPPHAFLMYGPLPETITSCMVHMHSVLKIT